jgi:hypothetical protein
VVETNGKRPMHTLNVEVDDQKIRSTLRDPQGTDPLRDDFRVDPRKREAIALFAALLRRAMDLDNKHDRLKSDLYQDLLRVLGRELFDLLFRDRIRAQVLHQLQRVHDGEITLRINLSFSGQDENWLSGLPWEYLHTPIEDDSLGARGGFLSRHAELLMSRRLQVRARTLQVTSPDLKVLLVSSSPLDLSRIDADVVEAELANLSSFELVPRSEDQAAGPLVETPPAEGQVVDYKWKATLTRLREAVDRERPDIIHFIGHGRCASEHGELALANNDGTPCWVSDDDFADVICQGSNLKLVFLQACESALPPPYVGFSGIAQSIAKKGTPAVVAMQYPIKVSTANKFAVAFYRALDEELDIDEAVERGRAAIINGDDPRARELLAFGLPVVYLADYGGLARRPGGVRSQNVTRRASATDAGTTGPQPLCAECDIEFKPGDRFCTVPRSWSPRTPCSSATSS